MSTKIVFGVIIGAVVIGGGIFLVNRDRGVNTGSSVLSACADVCQKANQACPSLINQDDCNRKCDKFTEETKKHLQESTSCEQITSKSDLIVDLVVPEAVTPKPVKENASECEAACGSYTGKCLTLVPNLTEAMLNDGMDSCMKECASWDAKKIDCMINAFDCEAFTNVCGL